MMFVEIGRIHGSEKNAQFGLIACLQRCIFMCHGALDSARYALDSIYVSRWLSFSASFIGLRGHARNKASG